LLSHEEKIDTSSASDELIFHVFGAIAHFERRLIAERSKHGIAAVRARGKRPSRQPVDADKVLAGLELVEAGLSPTNAASRLPLWSYVGLGLQVAFLLFVMTTVRIPWSNQQTRGSSPRVR